MKKIILLAGLIMLMPSPVFAQVEDDYFPPEPRATTPWIEWVTAGNIATDLEFIEGMRPHHAGALPMSEDYLADKNASSGRLKGLAKGIIKNQSFEIGVMHRLEELLKAAPVSDKAVLAQVAEKGLAQKQKFSHAPAPSIRQNPMANDVVSKRDVAFAKAMIVHHEGALDMCHDYLGNPLAVNGYMELLCLDILTSQSYEIALMHDVISEYPGDTANIKPSAILGMEHMNHGQHKKPAKSASPSHHNHH